jgi:hypothetical protein
MSLGRSRRFLSQENIQAQGATSVDMQLWHASPVHRKLMKVAYDFLVRTASMFTENKSMEELLASAVLSYSRSFDFNRLMLLRPYVDMAETNASATTHKANAEWNKVNPLTKAFARILAHLCANCVTPVDITVYRGMKDRRRAAHSTRDEAVSLLTSLSSISKLETQLKSMLLVPDLMWDALDARRLHVGMLNDKKDLAKANEILTDLKAAKKALNLENRDLDRLLHGHGDAVQVETFVSTSLSIAHARRFMDESCCLLQITVPAGTPCFYVSAFSEFTGQESELELVLPPCSRFIVQNRTAAGVVKMRYDGVSEMAKKRMTLDLPRLHVLKQVVDTFVSGQLAKRTLQSGLGFTLMCGQLNGTHQYAPLNRGTFLPTFSNDVLVNEWDTQHSEDSYRVNWRQTAEPDG